MELRIPGHDQVRDAAAHAAGAEGDSRTDRKGRRHDRRGGLEDEEERVVAISAPFKALLKKEGCAGFEKLSYTHRGKRAVD